MAISFTSTGVKFPDNTTQTSIGLGFSPQALTDVTTSRSSNGTIYTNTTGRPIFVFIAPYWARQNDIVIQINGNEVGRWGVENNFTVRMPIVIFVPVGATYAATIPGGHNYWFEVR